MSSFPSSSPVPSLFPSSPSSASDFSPLSLLLHTLQLLQFPSATLSPPVSLDARLFSSSDPKSLVEILYFLFKRLRHIQSLYTSNYTGSSPSNPLHTLPNPLLPIPEWTDFDTHLQFIYPPLDKKQVRAFLEFSFILLEQMERLRPDNSNNHSGIVKEFTPTTAQSFFSPSLKSCLFPVFPPGYIKKAFLLTAQGEKTIGIVYYLCHFVLKMEYLVKYQIKTAGQQQQQNGDVEASERDRMGIMDAAHRFATMSNTWMQQLAGGGSSAMVGPLVDWSTKLESQVLRSMFSSLEQFEHKWTEWHEINHKMQGTAREWNAKWRDIAPPSGVQKAAGDAQWNSAAVHHQLAQLRDQHRQLAHLETEPDHIQVVEGLKRLSSPDYREKTITLGDYQGNQGIQRFLSDFQHRLRAEHAKYSIESSQSQSQSQSQSPSLPQLIQTFDRLIQEESNKLKELTALEQEIRNRTNQLNGGKEETEQDQSPARLNTITANGAVPQTPASALPLYNPHAVYRAPVTPATADLPVRSELKFRSRRPASQMKSWQKQLPAHRDEFKAQPKEKLTFNAAKVMAAPAAAKEKPKLVRRSLVGAKEFGRPASAQPAMPSSTPAPLKTSGLSTPVAKSIGSAIKNSLASLALSTSGVAAPSPAASTIGSARKPLQTRQAWELNATAAKPMLSAANPLVKPSSTSAAKLVKSAPSLIQPKQLPIAAAPVSTAFFQSPASNSKSRMNTRVLMSPSYQTEGAGLLDLDSEESDLFSEFIA